MTYFERYLNGEYVQVWNDLQALGTQIRTEPLYADALAVALETMRRARENIERIIPRLFKLGYRFDMPFESDNWEVTGAVITRPCERLLKLRRECEESAGPLPLSIQTWYDIVGAIDLIGSFPQLQEPHPDYDYSTLHKFVTWQRRQMLDPLVVMPMRLEMENSGSWLESMVPRHQYNPKLRSFMISPDELQKADISGDVWSIILPNPSADGVLLGERHKMTFVSYLRMSFSWGGFPGFEQWPDDEPPVELINYLRSDLLPL